MKGKRYTTEDKIQILREVDGGKSVDEAGREKNIAEQTFYRWKRTFAQWFRLPRPVKNGNIIWLKPEEQGCFHDIQPCREDSSAKEFVLPIL
jgi:hypothetical protein